VPRATAAILNRARTQAPRFPCQFAAVLLSGFTRPLARFDRPVPSDLPGIRASHGPTLWPANCSGARRQIHGLRRCPAGGSQPGGSANAFSLSAEAPFGENLLNETRRTAALRGGRFHANLPRLERPGNSRGHTHVLGGFDLADGWGRTEPSACQSLVQRWTARHIKRGDPGADTRAVEGDTQPLSARLLPAFTPVSRSPTACR